MPSVSAQPDGSGPPGSESMRLYRASPFSVTRRMRKSSTATEVEAGFSDRPAERHAVVFVAEEVHANARAHKRVPGPAFQL